jgi:Ca2+-binding EF-hand superfamily protein
MKSLLLGAATLAVSAPALAQAPEGASPPAAPVTRAQALADADRRFDAMDANHDGKITPDERKAYREARHPRAGRDHEGREHKGRELTRDQFRERAAKRFDRIDTNRDGTIDANEREAARLLMRSRMAERQAD